MIDTRITSATELLRQVRDLTGQLYEILSPEIVSFEIMRGDLDRKRNDLLKTQQEKEVALIEIDTAKNTALKIKETAQEEATRIIEAGKTVMMEKMIEANKVLESCKEFALQLDKKRYMKLRDDAEKAVA